MINIYVSTTGNDLTGNGSLANPYRTWAVAITKVNDTCNMYFSNGVFPIRSLVEMSLSSYVVNYFGNGIDTVFEMQYYFESATGSFKGPMTINNCVIRPTNNYYSTPSGYYRVISYSPDSQPITFNYVLFTKSLNNSYPSDTLFYLHNNTNIQSNKVFNGCTFISPGSPAVNVASAKFTNCTSNVSVIGLGSLTSCISNQAYDSTYRLVNNDNNIYGVYSGWRDAISMLIVIDGEYYTINNDGKIIKTALNINNAFTIDSLTKINKNELKKPLKLIMLQPLTDSNIYNSIELNTNFINQCVLVNATDITMSDIKLKSDHKMLVSDDLKTWYNYYDEEVASTITIDIFNDDINNLKHYLINESKFINYINKKFNYILIGLNIDDPLDAIYENIKAGYKLADSQTDVKVISSDNCTIEITTAFDTNEMLIYLLCDNKMNITHSIKELKDADNI